MSSYNTTNKTKNICRFFSTKGGCREGDNCRFLHIKEEEKKDNKNHKKDQKKSHTKKNTECFTPSFDPSDMTVKIASASCDSYQKYPHPYQPRDVVLVTDLFRDIQSKENIYEKILDEIKNADKDEKIWKLWHGDTHYIADDKLYYKDKCPTFMKVIDRMKSYFNIDAKATRLNWFSDKNEWKPYHFDAAAVDPQKAKVQNFTVGVSFGDTREVSFEHAKTKTTVNFPLQDGSVYCFGSQVNIEWRHGIPPIKEEKFEKGRISIIIWGWVNMEME